MAHKIALYLKIIIKVDFFKRNKMKLERLI